MSTPTSGVLVVPNKPTVSPLATGAYTLFVRRYINNEIFPNGNAPLPHSDRSPPTSVPPALLYALSRGFRPHRRGPASFYTPGPARSKRRHARNGPNQALATHSGRPGLARPWPVAGRRRSPLLARCAPPAR